MASDRPDPQLTCYVPGCPHPRANPQEGIPTFCQDHWQEFTAFRPEALRQGVGVERYQYETREPWLVRVCMRNPIQRSAFRRSRL